MTELNEEELLNRQIAIRIRSVREILRINSKDFADELGIKRERMSILEGGVRQPRPIELVALSRKFGITPNYILLGDCAQVPAPLRHLLR